MSTYANRLYVALDTIVRLRDFRWVHQGFGRFTCRSCGAQKTVDYGDHEQPTTEKREPCSKSCPFGIADALLAERDN